MKTTVQYVARFVANPRTLVEFVKKNHVRMRNTHATSLTPGYVRLVESANTPVVIRRKGMLWGTSDKNRNVAYSLDIHTAPPAGPADYLTAYWCGYQAGSVRSIVLTNAYDFVFTALVNGCTIGLGHQANNARLMTHANAQNAGGMDTAQMSAFTITEMVNNNAQIDTVLQYDGYRHSKAARLANDGNDGSINALIFGIRVGQDQWEFYYERHNQMGVGAHRVQYGVKSIE